MHFGQRLFVLGAYVLFSTFVLGQSLDTAKLDDALGRSGQKAGEVYKFGFPRSDLHVTINGVAIKPGLALGSWAAFSGTNDSATVMGDLVLLQSEVNPVMEKLRASGFQIMALHNHLLGETPHVLYMHYMGHGPAVELATSLRSALSISKTPLGKPAAAAPEPQSPPDWAAQGVAESINFQEAGTGRVATTGDFVLTAGEVNPVISALEEHHISVTALHSHMLTEQPRLFFMHFWAVGTPGSVAEGIKAALGRVSVK